MNPPGPSGSRGRSAAGWITTGAALGYAALLHHGLGPPPESLSPPWWAPTGFLFDLLAGTPLEAALEDAATGVWVFPLPCALLAAAAWRLTRSGVARALAASAVVASLLFSFYGIASTPRLIWGFFHWRGSVTMVAIAGAVGSAAAAPWLAADWLRLGSWLRAALYLPLAFGVILLVRNTTGTDPSLPFSVSPWPAIPVFGLEVGAAALAAQFAGIAVGLAALAEARSRAGRARLAFGILGLALGMAFPALWLRVGDALDLLPFGVTAARIAAVSLLCLLATGLFAALDARGGTEAWRRRARHVGVGALLIGLPLVIAQVAARIDYTITREWRARPLIEALSAYYAREGVYPETLGELLEAGDLEEIPKPHIGFGFLRDGSFVYQGFGVGYVLEFSAPRWVQCAYSPPWQEPEDEGAFDSTFAREGEEEPELEEEEAFEDEEDLEASEEGWTCPSKPPELW